MDDRKIVELLLARDERAVSGIEESYTSMIRAIAGKYLSDRRDIEECVNDTLMSVWNDTPPESPRMLKVYIARIAKCSAINMRRDSMRAKRGGGQIDAVIDELEDVCSGLGDPEDMVVTQELTDIVNEFLKTSQELDAGIFIRRYWFGESSAEIAARYGINPLNVNLRLSRFRKKLREHLKKNGYE
ncbi:MAG: sigma-70 family RNA polymerase sigma factor [Lachnospiraceae bacterium]|nr:sigma-70 family RNA polymerase sigma factor [Lachnospiraceae bacterium]